MSINKVLNRPMFRQTALKKGHLKPIKANVGIMVGQPSTAAPVPALRKPPTFMERMSVSAPARFARGIFSLPAAGGYYAGDKFAKYAGVENELGRMPFGLGGAYLATKAMPALASAPALTSAALLAGPAYLSYAGQKERERIKAMSPAEYEEFKRMNEIKALEGEAGGFSDEELFGKFVPKQKLPSIEPKTTLEKRKRARGVRPETESVVDQLTLPDNQAVVDNKLIDLDKVVKNQRPRMDEIAGGGPTEPKKPDLKLKIEDDIKTDQQANANVLKNKQDNLSDVADTGDVKTKDGKPITSALIQRAREIRDELDQGKGSQAGLVFLANLASGLLTGTTTKGGLGGALEVFGQAIGPAVNNYAVMKMKENELERNSMETYLGYAIDEMKLFNEAAAGEPFDGERGIIQFIDEKGVTRNVKGRETKAGTMQVATGQLDSKGNMIYIPVGAAGIEGYGSPVQFFDKKTVDANTQKVGETLSNRYKTYKIANDVLDILDEQPTAGGPRGAIALFTNRFGGALSDVFGKSSSTKSEAKALYDQMKTKIETNDEISESEKKFLLKKLDFDDVYKDAEKRIKKRAGDIDSDTLEKLAVAETTLVYALANSFKDQDRLTQRDVQAAEKLVNLFTLTRGSEATRSSIKAIAEELESDILRYENDYRRLGGLELTLNSMRQQNKFRPQEGTGISQSMMKKYDEMSSEDLLKEYGL